MRSSFSSFAWCVELRVPSGRCRCRGLVTFPFGLRQPALKDRLNLLQRHVMIVDPQQRRGGAETQTADLSFDRAAAAIEILHLMSDERQRPQLLLVGGHLADLRRELVRGL